MKAVSRSFVAGAVAGAVLAAGILAGPGVVASVNGRAEAAAQPTAAKSSSKVVFENERVRVKDVTFAAGGGEAGMHTHELPHVGVILTPAAWDSARPT